MDWLDFPFPCVSLSFDGRLGGRIHNVSDGNSERVFRARLEHPARRVLRIVGDQELHRAGQHDHLRLLVAFAVGPGIFCNIDS